MISPPFNVLFICTGNSARSIIAESLLNYWGKDKFKAYSAGSFPKSGINPHAFRLLKSLDLPTETLRSKNWDEFAEPGAPVLDFAFTLCDDAAGETCPVWPGQPITAHWGMPDPAAVTGSETDQAQAFRETLRVLENRIKLLVALPITSLDRMSLTRRVETIGRIRPIDSEEQAS